MGKWIALEIILLRKVNQTPRPICRGGEMPQSHLGRGWGQIESETRDNRSRETEGCIGSKYIIDKDDVWWLESEQSHRLIYI